MCGVCVVCVYLCVVYVMNVCGMCGVCVWCVHVCGVYMCMCVCGMCMLCGVYVVFTLLIVSFIVQKLLNLIRSHLFIFAFISFTLGGGS